MDNGLIKAVTLKIDCELGRIPRGTWANLQVFSEKFGASQGIYGIIPGLDALAVVLQVVAALAAWLGQRALRLVEGSGRGARVRTQKFAAKVELLQVVIVAKAGIQTSLK